jgi:hypothetical protein
MTSAGGASRALVAAALARVEAFLLEPAEPQAGADFAPSTGAHPVIAAFGLARRCGTTTVARGVAAELAARDAGAAAVCSELPTAGIPLASGAASRLADVLADVPRARTRAVGRLCLVEAADQLALADVARLHAPLVLDGGSACVGGAPAAIADRVVVVATPALEPALSDVAASCLARVGAETLTVLNRCREPDERWAGRAAVELPDSRMGAQLALGGREPRGELGRAIAALADLCEGTR